MTEREITLLGHLRTRHGRRRAGLFVCEGLRCCREALERRPEWLMFALCSQDFADSADAVGVLARCAALGAPPIVVPGREFDKHAATENPQGVLCVLKRPDLSVASVPAGTPFVLVLDRIQDPGNLGTILRTAWAVGLECAWMTEGTTDPFGPKAVRAGMGAQFAMTLGQLADLPAVQTALVAAGYPRLWCAGPRAAVSCFDPCFDLPGGALVIGNEGAGIDAAAPGDWVALPMPGAAESVNAAQAATVFLFEAVRRGWLPARDGQPGGRHG